MFSAEFFQWLEDGSIGEAIRRSSWFFPGIESIHLLGLVVIAAAVLDRGHAAFRRRPDRSACCEDRP